MQDLSAWYGNTLAVKHVSMSIKARAITAIIGPAGCGKSTYIRCLNRMHEVSHKGRVEGCVILDDKDIYAKDVDPVMIRRRIGMVFQKPSPFPTMTIFDNVAAGLKLTKLWSRTLGIGRNRGKKLTPSGALGRGKRQAGPVRRVSFRRAAAAALYRQGAGRRTGDNPAG